MGSHYKYEITVATSNGSVKIASEEITKIEKAPDLGALIAYVDSNTNQSLEVLTIESFLRVLTYFKD